jgi:Uma2 family endonuclease
MTAIPLQQDSVFYPESDGKPMAESDLHRKEMFDLISALEYRYRDAPDMYVAGDLFIYYREGDPSSAVAPDVFMVKGVPNRLRKVFKLWEEGWGPCFVIEATSASTRREDRQRKWALYERLGVEEYFLHDPLGEWLTPPLQGYRLVGGKYQPILPEPDGTLVSRTTGLGLRREGVHLRLLDLASGELLPTDREAQEGIRL